MTIIDFFAKLPDPIITERLVLRQPVRDDVDAITELANNENLSKVLARLPFPYNEEHAIDFIDNLARNADEHAYAITLKDGTLIGVTGLHAREERVELGYWLGEPFWGQGLATEATSALMKAADETDVCPPQHALAISSNTGSINVLKKIGFVVWDEHVDDCGQHKGVRVTYLKREQKSD